MNELVHFTTFFYLSFPLISHFLDFSCIVVVLCMPFSFSIFFGCVLSMSLTLWGM